MKWWRWKRCRAESTAVQRARAERLLTERELEQTRADNVYVAELAAHAEKALRVNGFGQAASTAMKRRRHA